MKILFILEYYYPNIGGVETLFKTLAEKLVQNGNEVEVVTMRFSPELPHEEFVNGVSIKRLKLTNRIAFALLSGFYLYKNVRRCDIIHTTSSSAGFPSSVLAKLFRKKVVITFHELWGKLWFKLPFMDFFTRNFNFLFEQIIARLPYSKIVTVSDYTKNCLIDSGISTEKISRIYNGLDYEKFNGAKWQAPENFTFTFFGRLGVSKGLDILIPAAAKFFKKNPDASLKLIIPTIPKKFFAKVKKLLEQWQISKQCEILNNLEKEELNRHLCSSSCVVVSSYSEGFCFAATEAIAMNIPVISSDKGALKEVISGRYIKLNSLSFKSLAEALQLAKEGKWTISPIKKFDLLTQVKSYIELYESMVK